MAADNRSPKDGKHLEVLGYYNPLPGQDGGKRMGLKFDRVKFATPPPMLAMGRKGGPRDSRQFDPMMGRYSTPNKLANDDRPKDFEGHGDGVEGSG